MADLRSDPGSFRDPLSRVFPADDAVYRAFSEMGKSDLDAVWGKSFIAKSLKSGDLIESTLLAPSEAPQIEGNWAAVMRHPKLPFISYPYEWTFSMLKDAALLQLKLTRAALKDGVGVKDATPYNVQFVGARTQFIDAGSFEVRSSSDPWYGYKQFCELFLYPLMLQAYRGVQFQPMLRGSVNGIDPVTMRKLLGRRRRPFAEKGRLTHVALHAMAQERFASTEVKVKNEAAKAGMNSAVLDATLKKLIKLVDGLDIHDKKSTWSNYSDRAHYNEASLDEKDRFVRDAVATTRRKQLWDIGCNDGRFSRIASPHVDSVMAMDADPLVIDRLYLALRDDKSISNITPLYVDMADTGGGIGWRGQERPGLFNRGNPDFILYLAVIHHLAITYNIPLGSQLDLLASLTPEMVIEFPHEDDQMVVRLLRNKRDGVFKDYNLAEFERLLGERFDITKKMLLAGGTRTIFHAKRRG